MSERTIAELQARRDDLAVRVESYAGCVPSSPPSKLLRELADAERALSEAREKAHIAAGSASVSYVTSLQELAAELGDQTTPDAELPALAAKTIRELKAAAKRAESESENEELCADVATQTKLYAEALGRLSAIGEGVDVARQATRDAREELQRARIEVTAARHMVRLAHEESRDRKAGVDALGDAVGSRSYNDVYEETVRLLRERAAEIERLRAELSEARRISDLDRRIAEAGQRAIWVVSKKLEAQTSTRRPETTIPMRLPCPSCGEIHVDQGEYATKPHHTHACQACGEVWRPAIVATVGVRFLPGFKDEPMENES